MIGRTISHYTVLEKLGAGGMGEIYKAQDTRLNRFVAMKVLSTANSGDMERRRRFVQEAQAASALNHPNIITIHDVVSAEGMEFMVMEFVAGATLDDLIPKQGLNVQKTLDISVQVADALQAAHSAGIVHRDLKPGNVMVTTSGLVKILDFGIAKLTGPTPAPTGNTDETLPIDSPMTVEGSILGTVCYMSPEQAQAKAVDPRSDIFSFGLLMYEMLTGQKAFSGESALSTLSSILRDEAKPISQVVQGVPPDLQQIVEKAMRKEPIQRWQSMHELRAALVVLKQKADSGVLQTQLNAPPIASKKKSMALPFLIGGVAAVVLAAGAGGWWWFQHRPAQAPPVAQTTPAPAPHAPDTSAAAAPVQTPPSDAPMTNQNVLDMVENKVPEALVISQIKASKTNFDLSTNGVIQLHKGGVSPAIIELMRNPQSDAAAAAAHSAPRTTPPPVTTLAKSTAPPAVSSPAPVQAALPPAAPAPVTVTPPTPAPAASTAPAPTAPTSIHTVSILAGMPFNITLAQDIPAKLTAGQKINFTVTRDIKVGEVVVINKGTALTGEVADPGDTKKLLVVKNKATFKLSSVQSAGGTSLTIRATPPHTDKAERQIELPGNKNKDVLAPAGAEYLAYVDSDQTVTIKH